MIEELFAKLIEAHDVPVPQIMVERETDALINESKQYVSRYGSSWDDYLTAIGKTEAQFRSEFTDEAQKRVKTTLLIEAIAKAESIEAVPAEIEAELDVIARQYNQPREKIVELMGANLSTLVDGVVRTKTVDFLIEKANIVAGATKSVLA